MWGCHGTGEIGEYHTPDAAVPADQLIQPGKFSDVTALTDGNTPYDWFDLGAGKHLRK